MAAPGINAAFHDSAACKVMALASCGKPRRLEAFREMASVDGDGSCMMSTPHRANLGNMAIDGVEQACNGGQSQAFRAALASGDPPEICRSRGIHNGIF